MLSRLCRSADVPGTRLQMMRAQGPGEGIPFPSSPG